MRRRTPSRARFGPALALLAFLLVSAGSASAQTHITVTTTEDELNTDGDCSLREAITAADFNSARDACPAGGPGADSIEFGVTGTIVLGSPLPSIFFSGGSLTIAGPGAAQLTISGNNSVGPVLQVYPARVLTVRDLTIANAKASSGAAINNSGTLTVARVTFSDNHASSQGGALASGNSTTLTVSDCTFSGNGADDSAGAIGNGLGALVIGHSTFSGNRAGRYAGAISTFGGAVSQSTFSDNTATISGGAILNAGPLTVTGSTFVNNRATGLLVGSNLLFGIGGAIMSGGNPMARLTLVNSTFSGNSALSLGGAIRNQDTPLDLTNVTLTANGSGGLSNYGGAVSLLNTIFASNLGANCASSTAIVDRGGNVSYPGASCPGLNGDPQLLPLASNGGPTETHALGACSAALDAGVNVDAPATDQRGELRPYGPYVDSGAFEAQTPRNNPPLADAGPPQHVPAGPSCSAEVTLHGEGSSDPDADDSLSYAWSTGASGPTPTVSLPRGFHSIGLEVSDGRCSASDSVLVTVADETGPVMSGVPPPIVAECTSATGTPVSVPLPTAVDNCDGPATVASDAPAAFPMGLTTVRFTAYDGSWNSTTATTTIDVRDATAPVIASLTATPNLLWPPNHTMIPVSVSASASDSCGALAACRIVSVTSNEPVSDPAGDWRMTGPLALELRAERLGTGSGRVYLISVECADASGNASTGNVAVTVPKSQGAQ